MVFEIAFIILLVALSGFFSGSETAFFSLRESEIAQMQAKGEKYSQLIFSLRHDAPRLQRGNV